MRNVTRTQGEHRSEGGRLVTVDGRELPLIGVEVKAEAGGGVARVTLTQHFKNPYEEPLHVTYQVPMPQDGAVAGYAFRIGERRVVGEVDRLRMARERFERAIVEGKTAALLTQERSNLFTQELGNVPPGERITVELSVDQRLRWLSEGMWEWRFPTVVPPRYLGAQGRVADAERVSVDVAEKPTGIGATLELSIADGIADGRRPESPSHSVQFATAAGRTTARIEQGVALDRDLVVRWPVTALSPGVTLLSGRPQTKSAASDYSYGLLTLVPPAIDTGRISRDLVVLLDVSGSMSGPPMDRAKRVVGQLIETLDERDSVELIAFSDRPYRWKREAVAVNEKMKRAAIEWVMNLSAGGGTEMKSGVQEAIRPLRGEAQRQVILVTDGHIGFESEIVRELIEHLPSSARLHAIGVGSSVNRALTGPASRAGRGVEIIVDLDEDAERGAARLIAATRAPVLVELRASGDALVDVAPQSVPDLMGGAPVLMSLKLRPQGGKLVLAGRTPEGAYEKTITVPAVSPGEGSGAIAALFAREKVEDLEMKLAGGSPRGEIDAQIEAIGLTHQIATRLTAWVAVSEQQTVDPTSPTRRQTVPQELPHGMSASGIGLRPAVGAVAQAGPMAQAVGRMAKTVAPAPSAAAPRGRMSSAGAPPPPPRRQAEKKALDTLGFDDEEGAPMEEATAPLLETEAHLERLVSKDKKKGAAEPMAPKGDAGPSNVFLKGKRLASADGSVTIEIEADAMEWDPSAEFEAELEDGSRVRVKAEEKKSTRKSKVNAGTLLRLTFADPGKRVLTLSFFSNGVHYRVSL
ncbi:MAG: VIT domain-containing protein [Myxococcaceae bacterium]